MVSQNSGQISMLGQSIAVTGSLESKSEWVQETFIHKVINKIIAVDCRLEPNRPLTTQESATGLHCAVVTVAEKNGFYMS